MDDSSAILPSANIQYFIIKWVIFLEKSHQLTIIVENYSTTIITPQVSLALAPWCYLRNSTMLSNELDHKEF